jgi:hypothetical protein
VPSHRNEVVHQLEQGAARELGPSPDELAQGFFGEGLGDRPAQDHRSIISRVRPARFRSLAPLRDGLPSTGAVAGFLGFQNPYH